MVLSAKIQQNTFSVGLAVLALSALYRQKFRVLSWKAKGLLVKPQEFSLIPPERFTAHAQHDMRGGAQIPCYKLQEIERPTQATAYKAA